MSKIDWSKAPEGATHYWPGNSRFYEKVGESYFVSGQQNYGPVNSPESWVKNLVARPSPAWSGEGLPPVGTVCEWKEKTGFVWVAAEVLFISESSVVMKRADGFEWQMMTARTVFRPIRTPEQIAKDDRSKACDRMFGVILDKLPQGQRSNGSDICEALYDAGYRKVEQPQ